MTETDDNLFVWCAHSLRSKRFREVSEQRTRDESRSPQEKWGKWNSGERVGKRGRKRLQTIHGILKSLSWPVMPECAHRHLMPSSAVINLPINCLAFHIAEVNFRGLVWNQFKVSQLVKLFRKQRAEGGNGQISMNPNDQCRLCNCSSKVKFVNLSQTTYISTEHLVNPSKRKECEGEGLAQNFRKVGFEVVKWDKYSSLDWLIREAGPRSKLS